MPYTNTVLIHLDIPDDFVAQAKYVCGFFSDSWGLRVETSQDPIKRADAHIVYSSSSKSFQVDKQITIPFDPLLYNPLTACSALTIDCRQIWTRTGTSTEVVDLIAATFRLLTLADEQQIAMSSRDYLGNFFIDALPSGRRETVDLPMADYHAALFWEKLLEVTPSLRDEIVPRWPEGKKFAVSLTHDADAIHAGHPREICANIAKWALRRKRVFVDTAIEGLKHLKSPMDSFYWGFPGWREFEQERNLRSCFYLPVYPKKCKRRFNDCKSDVFAADIDWQLFRDMQAQDWEFGLHPALDSQKDLEEIILEKQAVEERLGRSIMGLRHHYLAIDNLNPSQTFRKHVESGFLYDASLGWQEVPGFRASTTLPFHPYDSERKTNLTLIEVPLMLMDTYIMKENPEKAIAIGKKIVEIVRELNGILTLNWHAETYCNRLLYANYRTVLEEILTSLLAERDVWFATPSQIVQWWNLRSEKLR